MRYEVWKFLLKSLQFDVIWSNVTVSFYFFEKFHPPDLGDWDVGTLKYLSPRYEKAERSFRNNSSKRVTRYGYFYRNRYCSTSSSGT